MLFAMVVIVGAGASFVGISAVHPPTAATASTGSVAPAADPPAFNMRKYTLDAPSSRWVVVDKLRPLNPRKYEPSDLVRVSIPRTFSATIRREANTALTLMNKEFVQSHPKYGLVVHSGYRSYATQKAVWDGDYTLTALPGYSEHQTGWAVDLAGKNGKCAIYECFANTTEGKWLAANSYKYGFILRYPKGMQNVTGYQFEPWHYRYVGTLLSIEMHNRNIKTLEQFFGLPNAPKYGVGGH